MEASLPEKGATEASSCPKGGNMWRHWYGLAQAWGSTTYDWTLGQILPRSREEGCQPNLTEALSREDTGLQWGKPYHGRIHIWDYPKGNQAIRAPSPVQGLTGDPGELTPVLGLASDCSAQSDCRECLEDSTRVHRPGNWTGGEKRRIPRVRGNGAASMTLASSSRPLPVTQHTGRNWLNAETVETCEGVRCRPACSSADVCQRGAVCQRMGGGNTPSGVSPHPQGARLALKLVLQGDGHHYPVGQPLFGDSLPFLLTSVEVDERLLAVKGAIHELVSSSCTSGKKGTGAGHGCEPRPAPRNHSSSHEGSGLGGLLTSSPILMAARASMAASSGSGAVVATTPEGGSPTAPSSSEDVNPSPDAAIDILSTDSAPN